LNIKQFGDSSENTKKPYTDHEILRSEKNNPAFEITNSI
jgi:hypothetical protein